MAKVSERTSLYRFYGARDELLYVGITNCLPNRFTDHDQRRHWWFRVERTKIEHYPTREEAAQAERVAIREEKPRFNVEGASAVAEMLKGDYPDVRGVVDRSLSSTVDVTCDLLDAIDSWIREAARLRRTGTEREHRSAIYKLGRLVAGLMIIDARTQEPTVIYYPTGGSMSSVEAHDEMGGLRSLVHMWMDEAREPGWEATWRWGSLDRSSRWKRMAAQWRRG